jgi:hypothetical protein
MSGGWRRVCFYRDDSATKLRSIVAASGVRSTSTRDATLLDHAATAGAE